MENALRALRLTIGVPVGEMVAVVRQAHPKYDKTVQSKCEHSEDYGVELTKAAMSTLYAAFDPERRTAPKRRRRDTHRLTCSIKARLESSVYEALQQLIRAAGYKTTQDWLADMVRDYIERSHADV